MKSRTITQVSWWLLALLVIAVLGMLDDMARHAAVLVPVAVAGIVVAFYAGRRSGRASDRQAATRRLEDAQRDRLVSELEHLAGRSLDEITESYRVIARRHGGDVR